MKIKEVHGWYKLRNYNGNCTLTQKKEGGGGLNNIEGRADRRRPRDRTLRSSQRNLSPAEGMILGKDRKVKEECQERDIKIIKRVSAHCLTEVSPTPSWTCSTQLRGPCAMSNILKHTYTHKHTGANAHACRHPTTALHQRAADIIRSPVIPEYLVHLSLKVHFNFRADLTGSLSCSSSIPARCTVTAAHQRGCCLNAKCLGVKKKCTTGIWITKINTSNGLQLNQRA